MRPEDVFQDIVNFMIFGSSIANISESSGISTISTNKIFTLKNGMLVEIGNNVYPISNITTNGINDYSFDITAVDIISSSWKLALYYEFGRALEVGNTLKDQKDDPVNKNKRFPLMWLLTDIEKTTTEKGYKAEIILGFIYLSEKNLKAKQRVDDNFEPILDPLVKLFKNTVNQSVGSRYFNIPYGEIREFNDTDKFKYGSIAGNAHIFNDITDAIQLTVNFNFVNQESCTPKYELPIGIGSMFIVS